MNKLQKQLSRSLIYDDKIIFKLLFISNLLTILLKN